MRRSSKSISSAQIPLPFGPRGIRPWRQEKSLFSGDWRLLLLVSFLVIGGLVMVYTASSLLAERQYHDSFYFIRKQLQWLVIGLLAFILASRINTNRLRDWIIPMTIVVFLLLLTPLVFGMSVNGSRRWIRIGTISFQPSELAKLFTVFYLAHYIAKKRTRFAHFFEGLVPPLIVVGLAALLVLLEPDFGTTVVIMVITLLLLFLGGIPVKQLLLVIGVVLPFLVYWVTSSPYRLERILTFMNPWEKELTSGFQVIQSQIALGSGGITGTGLAAGKQVLFFLPEPHTDFIFSLIGEAFGLLGTSSVLLLFLAILWRGTSIALQAENDFKRILAFGMMLIVCLPAVLNMGVVTGILPTKGLPLPFISYGGSSLFANAMAIGFLYNISRRGQISSQRLFS